MSVSPPDPLVSVVMSVYNGRRYLAEAVESILGQTFHDFEFIIIDDGSTDGANDDLRVFAARDTRIRLIAQENQGLTKALNTGLRAARGEFIARMDSDDIAYPERLARQVRFLQAHPEVVCLGAEVELVAEDGTRLGTRGHPRGNAAIRSRLLMGDGGAMTHPVVVFRREAAQSVGGFDERFLTTQDLDLFLRLTEIGTVENLQDTLLDWRQHPQSINRTKSETWRAMKALAIEKTICRIGGAAFAAQLFQSEPVFRFASDRIILGVLALQNWRRKEARRMFLAELREGPRRRDALEHLCEMTILSVWWKFRSALRRFWRSAS